MNKRNLRFIAIAFTILAAPIGVQAQTRVERQIASFFNIGGYFYLDNKAVQGLGSPKFYSEANYFGRSARAGKFQLSAGVEFISAADEFFPFSGGNSLSVIGVAGRLATPFRPRHTRYLLTVGLYAHTLYAPNIGVNATIVAPGAAIEADIPVMRYITFVTGIRVNPSIDGYNTSGIMIGLRFF